MNIFVYRTASRLNKSRR